MAAARMQRYALYLAAHDYKIEYKSTKKHCNADGLSRLPVEAGNDNFVDSVEMFHIEQFEHLPVTSEMVKAATRTDPVLSQVYDATMQGWPDKPPDGLTAFFNRQLELSVHHVGS